MNCDNCIEHFMLLTYKINMKAKHVQAVSYINVPMTHTQLALLYNNCAEITLHVAQARITTAH